MTNFLLFAHNFVLGGFSIYGAALLGRWVLGRGWHWAGKLIALLFVASLVVSGLSLMLGGTPDDLRIFTELLASAGSIIAAGNMLSSRGVRRNPWAQYGIPIALLVFLAWTWREQINDVRHGNITVPTVPVNAGMPSPTPVAPASIGQAEPTRAQLCAEGKLSKHSCD